MRTLLIINNLDDMAQEAGGAEQNLLLPVPVEARDDG